MSVSAYGAYMRNMSAAMEANGTLTGTFQVGVDDDGHAINHQYTVIPDPKACEQELYGSVYVFKKKKKQDGQGEEGKQDDDEGAEQKKVKEEKETKEETPDLAQTV